MTEQELTTRILQEIRDVVNQLQRDVNGLGRENGCIAQAIVVQGTKIDNVQSKIDALQESSHMMSLAFAHHSTRLDEIELRLQKIDHRLGIDQTRQ